MKLKVWQAFGTAVANLHRKDVLRNDIDNVNQAVYDGDAGEVRFGQGSGDGKTLTRPATVEELSRNLVPLMQFVFSNKAAGDPEAVWDEFRTIYLATMDKRGPQVMGELRKLRAQLREAANLNMEALAQAYAGKLDDAKANFKLVLQMRLDAGDYEGYCGTLLNLALAEADAGDFESAHAAVDLAVQTAREHGRQRAWTLSLFQKGFLLKRQGNQAGALKYGDLALYVWNRSGLPVPEQFIALSDSLRATK